MLKKFILTSLFHLFISVQVFCSDSKPLEEDYKYQVSVCAIFQNEAPYLKEWIEFHRLVGIKHFFLFNNLSEDHYKEVLNEYIESSIVELIEWPFLAENIHEWNDIQCKAYNHALELAKSNVKWLAFLDTDEFLFPVQVHTLQEFLMDYQEASGISVNWQMYGTSFVKKIQANELLTEKLILKATTNYSENIHVKPIVRPECVEKFVNPHFAIFKEGFYSINSNNEMITGPFSPSIPVDKIRINHYWSRDESFFFNFKVPRREHWEDSSHFKRLMNMNEEEDLSIYKYIPKLKEKLLKNHSLKVD